MIRAPEIRDGVKTRRQYRHQRSLFDGDRKWVRIASAFDAIPETLARTSLGDLAEGDSVNVERAMRADARFDGHIVQGHVDGVGRVAAMDRQGEDVRLYIDCDEEFAALLVEKGSVTIAGISLTVVGVRAGQFDVALIPHTLAVTTLGTIEVGERVNLEADILGKYVQRYLSRIRPSS